MSTHDYKIDFKQFLRYWGI